MIFLWAFTALSSIIGALDYISAITSATSAPQQGAGAAMAAAAAIIPYVFTRAVEGILASRKK